MYFEFALIQQVAFKKIFLFGSQAIEFFFFAAAIGFVTVIFAVMTFFYKYVELTSPVAVHTSNEESKALIGSHDKGSDEVRDSEI